MFGLVRGSLVVLGAVAVLSMPTSVNADHSWNGYHWARTSNPFTLRLGDNVSSVWDPYLTAAASDWSASTVLDTKVAAGRTTSSTCAPTAGRIEVCNAAYGDTGWLGLTSLSIADGTHITQGTLKINDTYFATAQYDKPAWRRFVLCHEIGHTLGLDHVDNDFDNANLNTCMDLTRKPVSNQHPNSHDFTELVEIYSKMDSVTTVGRATSATSATAGADSTAPATDSADSSAAWGREVSRSSDGRVSVFVRDLGADNAVVTEVLWAG